MWPIKKWTCYCLQYSGTLLKVSLLKVALPLHMIYLALFKVALSKVALPLHKIYLVLLKVALLKVAHLKVARPLNMICLAPF